MKSTLFWSYTQAPDPHFTVFYTMVSTPFWVILMVWQIAQWTSWHTNGLFYFSFFFFSFLLRNEVSMANRAIKERRFRKSPQGSFGNHSKPMGLSGDRRLPKISLLMGRKKTKGLIYFFFKKQNLQVHELLCRSCTLEVSDLYERHRGEVSTHTAHIHIKCGWNSRGKKFAIFLNLYEKTRKILIILATEISLHQRKLRWWLQTAILPSLSTFSQPVIFPRQEYVTWCAEKTSQTASLLA